jgi:hypothetical protein
MKHPFTHTYIQMARAAEEIQAMRPNGPRPWDAMEDGDYLEMRGEIFVAASREALFGTFVWLPRLDQLLGMLGKPIMLLTYAAYADPDQDNIPAFTEYYYRFEDWHELALAIAMRRLHGKVWRDGAWVKA